MGAFVGQAIDAGGAGWAAAFLVLLTCAGLAVVGVWLAVTDLREHRLPGAVVRPTWLACAICLGAAAQLAGQPQRLLGLVVGAAGLWGLYRLLRACSGGALGRGDVRLAGLLGTALGFVSLPHLLWATLMAFAVGGLWAVAVLLRRGEWLDSRIPFGPPMLIGAAAALILL